MRSRWIVSMVVVGAAGRAFAQAPAPESAAELLARGRDIVKTGDHGAAVPVLERALELEPTNNEVKLALADAERESGQCDRAVPRYKELIASGSASDQAHAKESAQRCPGAIVVERVAPPAASTAVAPPPRQLVTREGPPSLVTAGVLAGAGVSLGASFGLFLAARASADDADDARSFADHERITNRADRLRVASYVTLAAALGLGGYAVYRIKFRSERSAEVAVTPTPTGGAMIVRGSW